jgi:hypothetical protein
MHDLEARSDPAIVNLSGGLFDRCHVTALVEPDQPRANSATTTGKSGLGWLAAGVLAAILLAGVVAAGRAAVVAATPTLAVPTSVLPIHGARAPRVLPPRSTL